MAVGARSVEDQQHRFVVSGADFATGFKKIPPLEISMLCLMGFMLLKTNKVSLFLGKEVETTGNPLSHAILVEQSMSMVRIFLTTTMII